MVKEITGGYILDYLPNEDPDTKPWKVDFSPPFRRVSMITELERKLDVEFPPATTFDTPGTWRALCICVFVKTNNFIIISYPYLYRHFSYLIQDFM